MQHPDCLCVKVTFMPTRQLDELLPARRWCVLLVSRRAGRIFRGTRKRLVEVTDVLDDVHRRISAGGLSQDRYQRGIEHEVDEHIRGTDELLFEHWQHRPFDQLLIGGPHELHDRVEHDLHAELRKRLSGTFEIDVERSSADEVHARALAEIEDFEDQHEGLALQRVREGLAPAGHAAAGLDDVLPLLNEGRVRTMLLVPGFSASGVRCPQCGWLGLASAAAGCPVDGAALEPSEDIVEDAVAAALAQDAEVLLFQHRQQELAAYGSIAVLLRY
jgi:peptide chain release factor subunit 1